MHLRRSILATKVGCAAFTRKAYSQFNTQREAYYCIRQLPDNLNWICMQRHYYIVYKTKYNSETTNSNCQTMIFGAIWKKKIVSFSRAFLALQLFFFYSSSYLNRFNFHFGNMWFQGSLAAFSDCRAESPHHFHSATIVMSSFVWLLESFGNVITLSKQTPTI